MSDIATLELAIRELMRAGIRSADDDELFNDLALRTFRYQWAQNEPYRRFCERRAATPQTVTDWGTIPSVPTAAFKHLPLTTFAPEQAQTVYYTSGTTEGAERRGAHYIRDVSLYEASLRPNLAAHLFPDSLRMPIYVLFWEPARLPSSSLAHMIADAIGQHGSADSRYVLDESGLDNLALATALDAAVDADQPVCLMGVMYSFVLFLDWCTEQGRRWQLPAGSRLMDTGGTKGRVREIARDELYALYTAALGIPSTFCINEYGMTELGSQFYDGSLRSAVYRQWQPRHKVVPPWVRTQIVDPATLAPVTPGQIGLLRHYDLANLHSVLAIQTEDLGVAVGAGFEVLGRASGAELRGCSLAVEDMLAARRNGSGGELEAGDE
ncbi:MAG: long-chain fatty acid--CoA ligase [Herpetosiphonaceae bacterium]|nr:long-chain fatty acid--CoA ligase [Herpetosiphonaceae bacterium]